MTDVVVVVGAGVVGAGVVVVVVVLWRLDIGDLTTQGIKMTVVVAVGGGCDCGVVGGGGVG